MRINPAKIRSLLIGTDGSLYLTLCVPLLSKCRKDFGLGCVSCRPGGEAGEATESTELLQCWGVSLLLKH